MKAAAWYGATNIHCPPQYLPGRDQIFRNCVRERADLTELKRKAKPKGHARRLEAGGGVTCVRSSEASRGSDRSSDRSSRAADYTCKYLVFTLASAASAADVAGPHHVALLDHHMAVGDLGQRIEVLVDQQDRLALALEPREARPDLGCGSAAPGLRSPRPGSAASDWSSARGRSPASAARRRRAGCPCCRAARRGAGRTRRRAPASSCASPCRAAAVATRFSSTVSVGKICRPSGTRPSPRCAMR